MGNKIKYNLKNVHVAKLTETEENGVRSYNYAAPRAIPGAVSLSLDADLQEALDKKGVLVEKITTKESVKFALLFEFDGDINCIRHVMYNCSSSRPSIESETKEDTIEPGTEKLTIAADPRADGLVKSKTGETTDATTYANWYQSVYVPDIEEEE